jgi:hypothetical protein
MSKDLIILVADKNMEFTLKGLFSRPQALGIKSVEMDIFVHPDRDPGCLRQGDTFLKPFADQYRYGLVMLDREGCGRERNSRKELENGLETRLGRAGWNDRAKAVIFDPELEIWVWSDSPHVAQVLGWSGRQPDLKTWLISQKLLEAGKPKPKRPKEAVEEALRVVREPRSSSLYQKLAQKVSFERCTDPSFLKFKTTLQQWFADQG